MSTVVELDPRPALAFRVGVTGTRKLEPAEQRLRLATASILKSVQDQIARLVQEPDIRAAYRGTVDGTLIPQLRLISPLAEGADRLVADEALKLGYELEVVLPFTQTEYERDFPETVETFRTLLARSGSPPRVLTLDGARNENQDRSYEAVGRMVVRNCDLLIAIWDGEEAKGLGGTGEIVQFAAQNGGPVWWIHSDGTQPPVLLQEAFEFRWRDHRLAPSGTKADEGLAAYLRQIIAPPLSVAAPARHWPFIGWNGVGVDKRGTGSFDNHFTVKEPTRLRLWRSYAGLMRLIADRAASSEPTATPPNLLVSWWSDYYDRADRLSGSYGDRYRSSYVLVFALGSIALIAAVAGLAFEEIERWTVLIELVLLLAAGVLFYANTANNWHGRWLGYRLLAELCRKQRMLVLLGWSLPIWETASLADEPRRATAQSADATLLTSIGFHEDWVGWYFSALVRAAALPTGSFAGPLIEQSLQLGEVLLDEQTAYHQARSRQSHSASHFFGVWGKNSFILTVLLVILKLLLYAVPAYWGPMHWRHDFASWLGLFCAVFPTITAFLIGIRAHAEFELLASQSDQMLDLLQAARERLAHARLVFDLNPQRTLMSQEVGAEIFDIALAMLGDVKGWAQLFRQKRVEMG